MSAVITTIGRRKCGASSLGLLRPASSRMMRTKLLGNKSTLSMRRPKTSRNHRKAPKTVTAGLRQKATLAPPNHHLLAGLAARSAQQQAQQVVRRKTVVEALAEILGKPRTIPIPRWISPRHHTTTLSEICGHSSFVLVALSYAEDDFLMLRIIAVAGSASMLFFTYFHPHGRVLWLPFKWNCLFIAINSYRIGKVFLDRHNAERLSGELLNFRRNNFYLMDPVDFSLWVRRGKLRELKKGEVLTVQGESNRYVRVVVSGTLRVLRDGKLTYLLEEGNFVSESGLHAGLLLPGAVESCCSIVADSSTARVLTWDRTELVELMERHASLRRTLKVVLSWDIMRKLKAQRGLISIMDDPEEWTERRNRQTFHRYEAILQCLLSHPEYLEERRPELNKYRKIHHIDDEHHNMALRQVGWTPEEFAAGHRENDREDNNSGTVLWAGLHPHDGSQDANKAQDKKHDLKWYLNDVLIRIFG